jgi:hypothetical protein
VPALTLVARRRTTIARLQLAWNPTQVRRFTMVRKSRLLVLLMLLATIGLGWPIDAAAQRRPAPPGRGGVAVARPAAGPYHGGYGYRAPYYPARYYYPPYYYGAPYYYAPYSWGIGFGFGLGVGWSASFRVGYPYAYPYRYAYPYPYPYAYAYPSATTYAYPSYYPGAVQVAPPSPQPYQQDSSPQYDPQGSAQAPRSGNPSGFATLSLRISPADAEILVDGQPWGRPSADNRFALELSEGRHQVEVRKDGFGSYVRTIDLLSGRTVTLNVALTPRGPVPAQAAPPSTRGPVRIAQR